MRNKKSKGIKKEINKENNINKTFFQKTRRELLPFYQIFYSFHGICFLTRAPDKWLSKYNIRLT